MKMILFMSAAAVVLAGCGVDGAPIKPQYTLKQTVGVNSRTGGFSRTALHIDLTQRVPADDVALVEDSENSY
jgi:uncharacterized lipoprotein YmbA